MPEVPSITTLRQQASGLIARAPQRGVLAAIQAAATAAAVNGTPLTAGMDAQALITISQSLIDQADSDVQAIETDQWIRLLSQLSTLVAQPSVSTGTGSPEGVVTAVAGSIYVEKISSTQTQIWTKASGSENTGWI